MSINVFIRKIWSFLFNVKHLLLIIVLTGLPIGIYFTYDSISTKNKKEREKEKLEVIERNKEKIKDSLSKVRNLDTLDLLNIGLRQVILRTKYVDGFMNFFLQCNSVDTNKFPILKNSGKKITILLLDSDGFEIYKINLSVDSLTSIVSNDNIVTGFEYQGKEFISIEFYKAIKHWSITWSF